MDIRQFLRKIKSLINDDFNVVKFHIKSNFLLDELDYPIIKTTSTEDFFDQVKMLSYYYEEIGATHALNNLNSLNKDDVKKIKTFLGDYELNELIFLAVHNFERDFEHFFNFIMFQIKFLSEVKIKIPLPCDNHLIFQGEYLRKICHNVIQPSYSRKIYNPGVHKGHFVYGFGRPRILVSHPFKGLEGEIYSLYDNSLDIVTSLVIRGFSGSFLFLDNMRGLNFEVSDIPAWLVKYSIFASHSDMVIFVKTGKDFTPSQKKEILLTPDRIQKKIINIPNEEWVFTEKPPTVDNIFYVDKQGDLVSQDQFHKVELQQHDIDFINHYTNFNFPDDRLIIIDKQFNIKTYPLDYPCYK